jgi:small-conductance mechanosensitive channel
MADSSDDENKKRKGEYSAKRRLGVAIGVIVVCVAVGYYATLLSERYASIKPYTQGILAVIILIGGYVVIRIISAVIERIVQPHIGPTHGRGARNLFQIIAVVALLSALAAVFQVNLTAVLVGYGFAAIVLGLAAQQVLGNIFAGVSLIISRPFDVGDRVTMTMPQYGLIGPSYSHESLVPGYTGVVLDIGIFFTSMLLDDGSPAVLPNSAVIGAMVFNYTKAQDRMVKVRIDLGKDTDFEKFKAAFLSRLKEGEREESKDAGGMKRREIARSEALELKKISFEISDASTNTYQVSIFAWSKEKFDETVKSVLIRTAIEAEKEVKPKESAGAVEEEGGGDGVGDNRNAGK